MTLQYLDPSGPFWQFRPLRLVFCYWKGTIFQVFWIELLVAAGAYTLLLALWYEAYGNVLTEEIPDWLREAHEALQYIHGRYQAALSLMLGFYTATIFKRWWETGATEGKAMGMVQEMTLQIASLISDSDYNEGEAAEEGSLKETALATEDEKKMDNGLEKHDRKDRPAELSPEQARFHLVRWLNLSHALVVGQVYEKQPNEFSLLSTLNTLGLLTDTEHDFIKTELSPHTRYTAPLLWFLKTLRQLKVHSIGEVVDPTIIMLNANLGKFRSSLQDLYIFKSTPIPLLYRQLANFTVRVYMVIVALYVALDDINSDNTLGFSSSNGIYWLLLAVMFEYFVFVGWLTVADALGNPFRTWSDQYQWENSVRQTVIDSHILLSKTASACPTLTELAHLEEDHYLSSSKRTEIIHRFEDEIQESGKNPDLKGCRRVERTLTGY